jgi:DNA-binding NtrC family response regulator
MRLLIIGALEGQLSEATKLAMQGGAKVQHASSIDIAMSALRAGRGADLLFVDVMVDIPGLIAALEAERIHIPVVACGTETNAAAAVNAIRAGAKEYIPLPPDAELIAAVIAAVARESTDFLFRDPGMARVVQLADQIAPSDASVLITGECGTGKEVMA